MVNSCHIVGYLSPLIDSRSRQNDSHSIEPCLPTLKVESLTGVQWDLTIMEHTIPGRVSQEYSGPSL